MKIYAEPVVQLLVIAEDDVLTSSSEYTPGDDDNGKDDIFAD